MSLLPSYVHIVNPKLKHIYLSFDEAGNLVIKSPKVSQKQIEQLLLKKASWITSTRKKLNERKGKHLNFSQACELYFLGQAHTLTLMPYERKRTKLTFDGHDFCLYYSVYDEKVFQKKIDNFYKEEAQNYLPSHVEKWSQAMGLSYQHITFRKTKRQWGSCSSSNKLSFNTMMMKLPLDVIQYIIIHEIAHIQHKHHQKTFWKLVEHYLPSYKQTVQTLKAFST